MLHRRPLRLSLTRLTGTWTASSEATNYGVANLAAPQRPFLPWKTTATSAQWARLDLGSAQAVDEVALIATNFTAVRIQGNASDTWGSPAYDQAVTIGRNPWTGRYQHVHRVPFGASFTYRYLRISIPSQTPVDAAVAFSLGGVWAGRLTALPRSVRWGLTIRVVEPHKDVAPEHEGWRQRLILGEPLVRIAASRFGQTDPHEPASGDELEDWLDLDRQTWTSEVFLLDLNRLDASQVWPVRRLSERAWTLDYRRAAAPWELEEAIGP